MRISLLDGQYKFQGYKGIAIRKDSNPYGRGVFSLHLKDRIVQDAIRRVIQPRLKNHICTSQSYGRIRVTGEDISLQHALRRLRDLRHGRWTLRADIVKFFNRITQDLLIEQIQNICDDESANYLLRGCLDSTLSNSAELLSKHGTLDLWYSGHGVDLGVPQGSLLASLFANLYLADFDRSLESKGIPFIRYIDDLAIVADSKEEAHSNFELVSSMLNELGLSLHACVADDQTDSKSSGKSGVFGPCEPLEFLGTIITPNSKLLPSPKAEARFRKSIRHLSQIEIGNDVRTRPCATSFMELCTSLSNTLDGWVCAYSHCDLSYEHCREIDRNVAAAIFKWCLANKMYRKKDHVLHLHDIGTFGIPKAKYLHEKRRKDSLPEALFREESEFAAEWVTILPKQKKISN